MSLEIELTDELLDRWLERLRDPKARKARGRLRNKRGGMCCLGHLADLVDPDWRVNPWDGSVHHASLNVTLLSKLTRNGQTIPQTPLAEANDDDPGFPIHLIERLRGQYPPA